MAPGPIQITSSVLRGRRSSKGCVTGEIGTGSWGSIKLADQDHPRARLTATKEEANRLGSHRARGSTMPSLAHLAGLRYPMRRACGGQREIVLGERDHEEQARERQKNAEPPKSRAPLGPRPRSLSTHHVFGVFHRKRPNGPTGKLETPS